MSKLCTECPFEMFVFFNERKQEFWKERRKAQDLGTLGSPLFGWAFALLSAYEYIRVLRGCMAQGEKRRRDAQPAKSANLEVNK